jgi:hypothetical protein
VVTSSSPVTLSSQLIGPQIILSWPADHIGWTLQTNASLISGWTDVAGSASVNSVTNIVDLTRSSAFYRLRQ